MTTIKFLKMVVDIEDRRPNLVGPDQKYSDHYSVSATIKYGCQYQRQEINNSDSYQRRKIGYYN